MDAVTAHERELLAYGTAALSGVAVVAAQQPPAQPTSGLGQASQNVQQWPDIQENRETETDS